MMRRVTDLTIASAWACLLLPVAIGPHSHAWGEEPRDPLGRSARLPRLEMGWSFGSSPMTWSA